jgi:hypothetical protein
MQGGLNPAKLNKLHYLVPAPAANLLAVFNHLVTSVQLVPFQDSVCPVLVHVFHQNANAEV